MPTRKDGRIEKGQSVATAISARAWNRAQQAADVVLGVQPGIEAGNGAGHLPYTWIYAYVAEDTERFECLRLTRFYRGPWNDVEYAVADTLTDSQAKMQQEIPVVVAGRESAYQAEGYNTYGITVDPIKAGSIGRIAISGVVACNVYCRQAWHNYAVSAPDGTGRLWSAPFGCIQIMFWHPDSPSQNAPFTAQRSNTTDSGSAVNRMCSALVRIGNVPPIQTIVIDVPAPWPVNTTKVTTLATVVGQGLPSGLGSFAGIANGTPLEVTNVLADIKDAGRGIASFVNGRWHLVNWTPASIIVNGTEFRVPAYTVGGI